MSTAIRGDLLIYEMKCKFTISNFCKKTMFPMMAPTCVFDCCYRGDFENVQLILEERPSILVDSLYKLHYYAIKSGSLEICKYLLAKSAHVETGKRFYDALLWYAAKKGHAAICEVFLACGANINYNESHYTTLLRLFSIHRFNCLQVACLYEHEDVCKLLLPPLLLLLKHNTTSMERLIIIHVALHITAYRGNVNISRLLIEHGGADVNWQGKETRGDSPLMVACKNSHFDMCLLLVEHGAFIDLTDWDGMSALDHACRGIRGISSQSDYCRVCGATPRYRCEDDGACRVMRMEMTLKIAELLLLNGANVNGRMINCRMLILDAFMSRDVPLCELLLAYGADGRALAAHVVHNKMEHVDVFNSILQSLSDKVAAFASSVVVDGHHSFPFDLVELIAQEVYACFTNKAQWEKDMEMELIEMDRIEMERMTQVTANKTFL